MSLLEFRWLIDAKIIIKMKSAIKMLKSWLHLRYPHDKKAATLQASFSTFNGNFESLSFADINSTFSSEAPLGSDSSNFKDRSLVDDIFDADLSTLFVGALVGISFTGVDSFSVFKGSFSRSFLM